VAHSCGGLDQRWRLAAVGVGERDVRRVCAAVARAPCDLRPSTAELYAILWRKWLEPDLGDIALGALTPERWRTWFVDQTANPPGPTQPATAYRLAGDPQHRRRRRPDQDEPVPHEGCVVRSSGPDGPPRAASGITSLHFHDLRGSAATWAATSGATARELMARLGHSTPSMALRYQHATLERDQAIAERLGALMRTAGEEPDSNVEVVHMGGSSP